MLCPSFHTVDVPYRTLSDMAGSSRFFPSASYNEALLGEEGFECIDRLDGLFMSDAGGALTDSGTIVVTGWTRQRWWPGWGRWRWEFDAETGAFLRRGAAPGGYYAQDVRQGAGGELWLQLITGPLQRLGPDYQPTGKTLRPETYGAISFGAVLVDLARDRLIANVDVGVPLQVFRLSTGERLHTLPMPFRPVDLCFEEGSRAYVLTEGRQVYALDYESGRFLAAVKLGPGPALWLGSTRMAWDRRYRRLLLVDEPAEVGFEFTTQVVGYQLRPVVTHLCTPIPLRRLRAGQPTPVLVKAVGDLGEGLGGLVTVGAQGAASVARNAVALDGGGEGRVDVIGLAEGSGSLDLAMEVPCRP